MRQGEGQEEGAGEEKGGEEETEARRREGRRVVDEAERRRRALVRMHGGLWRAMLGADAARFFQDGCTWQELAEEGDGSKRGRFDLDRALENAERQIEHENVQRRERTAEENDEAARCGARRRRDARYQQNEQYRVVRPSRYTFTQSARHFVNMLGRSNDKACGGVTSLIACGHTGVLVGVPPATANWDTCLSQRDLSYAVRLAIAYGHLETLEWCVAHVHDTPALRGCSGRVLLRENVQTAVEYHRVHILEWMIRSIRASTDPQVQDQAKNDMWPAAMHMAISYAAVPCAKLIAEELVKSRGRSKGALRKLRLPVYTRHCALDMAAASGSVAMLEFLWSTHGVRQSTKHDILACAARSGSLPAVRWVLTHQEAQPPLWRWRAQRATLWLQEATYWLLAAADATAKQSCARVSELAVRYWNMLIHWRQPVPPVAAATAGAAGAATRHQPLWQAFNPGNNIVAAMQSQQRLRNYWDYQVPLLALDGAARAGSLPIVELLHREIGTTGRAQRHASDEAMRRACKGGHLSVVEFLHRHRHEGCTTEAWDVAAMYGHLRVLEFLHANRTEGCTTDAMDFASANGHLPVVEFLHVHRQEGCTTQAMDLAAAFGHEAVVRFLCENRTEGCAEALELAATNGHLRVIEYLHGFRGRPSAGDGSNEDDNDVDDDDDDGGGGDGHGTNHFVVGPAPEAMSNAASSGHVHVMEWLHKHRPEDGCRSDALSRAASAGHLRAVEWLAKHRSADIAANVTDLWSVVYHRHFETLEWLQRHRPDFLDLPSEILEAAALGDSVRELRFLRKHRMEGDGGEACISALSEGSLRCVKFLMEECKLHPSERYLVEAAKNANDVTLDYLVAREFTSGDPDLVEQAMECQSRKVRDRKKMLARRRLTGEPDRRTPAELSLDFLTNSYKKHVALQPGPRWRPFMPAAVAAARAAAAAPAATGQQAGAARGGWWPVSRIWTRAQPWLLGWTWQQWREVDRAFFIWCTCSLVALFYMFAFRPLPFGLHANDVLIGWVFAIAIVQEPALKEFRTLMLIFDRVRRTLECIGFACCMIWALAFYSMSTAITLHAVIWMCKIVPRLLFADWSNMTL